MMRWLALILCLLAGSATAQQGPVRSGAHPGFTRLTLPLSRGTDWQMNRTATGYDIRVDAPLALDLSRVYDLIDRSRLTGIDATTEVLSLAIGCTCHATAFVFRDSYLVIDILDGPADTASPFEVALDTAGDVDSVAQDGPPDPATVAAPGRMVLPLAPGTAPVPVATIGLRADRTAPTAETAMRVDEASPALAGLEREVVDSLARAASQGLLDLAPDAAEALDQAGEAGGGGEADAAADPDTVARTDDSAPAAGSHIAARPRSDTPGLLAQTSLDALQTALDEARGAAGDGARCWPPQFTDLTVDDDGPADFGTRIGTLRANVTDDRDRPDADAVAALARGYLSYGFGEEAIQSLQIDGVTDRGRLALRAMAEVIDDLPQSGPDLAAQVGCPGSTGLWAVLADGTPEAAAKVEQDQIVQHFKMLPEPVQTVLGPRLADLLRQAGRADMAELALAPARRMAAPAVDVTLAETALAVERGDVAAATETLADLAARDARVTPDALVRLVDLQLAQQDPVTPETLSLLEAYQFEFRGQPVVADLMRARVAALARQGDFEQALTLLPAAEDLLDEDAAVALRSDVTRGIATGAEEMMFLDVAFRPMGRDVAPDVQNMVAARLLDLGFPDRAAEVVAGPAIGSVMAERRYLRATAAMDMGDPEAAAAQLAGVSTPRAKSILGIAQADGPDAAAAGAEAAWRRGDWTALANSGDQLLQEAAALVREDVPAIPDTTTPLASGRALIDDAARTRDTIDTLMSRYAPPS